MLKKLSIMLLTILVISQTVLGPMMATAETVNLVDHEEVIDQHQNEQEQEQEAVEESTTATDDELQKQEPVESTTEQQETEQSEADINKSKDEAPQEDAEVKEQPDEERKQEETSDTEADSVEESTETTDSAVEAALQEAYQAAKQAVERALTSEKKADIEQALSLIELVEDEELQKELAGLLQDLLIRPAAEVSPEFFDLKIADMIDPNGQPYGPNHPIKPEDKFTLKIDWALANGHNYQAGDYITFDLPEELALTASFEGDLANGHNEVFATYEITQDGKGKLTFTDLVQHESDVKGWLELRAQLDQDIVEEKDGQVVIGQIDNKGELTLPIDRSPKDKTVEKQGKPNKSYNADEIEWTVTINKTATSFKNVVLNDILPAGTIYKEGSLKVEKQRATLNGTLIGNKEEVSGIVPTIEDGQLSIDLGDVDEVYTLTYTTTVTDDDQKSFKNSVTFNDDDLKPTKADATVTINRGEPLKKGAVKHYDPKTGIIVWYLDINYNQKDLTDVTLTDSWAGSEAAGKMALVDGTVKFQEMAIDANGKASAVGQAVDPSTIGATVVKEEDGFKVTGITTDKAYRVLYETKATDRQLDGFRIQNKASFNGTEAGTGYNVGQYIGVKTPGKIDYNAKTVEWEIKVNMDEAAMNDVVITDTLGDGLTLLPDSLTVTHGGATHDYQLIDGANNPFKIDLGSISKEVIIKYKTTFDADHVPNHKPTNRATVNWVDPDGKEFNKELSANTQLNKETVDSSWKNASYDPSTKEVTWTIIANYRENAYENFNIVDTPLGNQQLIEESIRVTEMKVETGGNHVDVGPAENAQITTKDNNLTIQLGKTNKAYKVVYKTSVADLADMEKTYNNKADIKDGNDVIDEVEASIDVYGQHKYGDKRGKHEEGSRTVDWSIDVNLAQEKIINLELIDEITNNQDYLVDTIKVYEASLKNDLTVTKGAEVNPSEYELVVDGTTFSIKWNEPVDRAFIVEYSTMFFAKTGDDVGNTYRIAGDNIDPEEESASNSSTTKIGWMATGGAEGTAGYLRVHKIDSTYGQPQQALEGIEFALIDPSNDKILKTVKTDANGYADFGRLLFGEYQLREVNPPAGYVGFEEQTIQIDKAFVVGESDPIDYTRTIENYQVNGTIELVKRDEKGKRLAGAEFTLFTADGTEVETKTTDELGEIVFNELTPGNYYVQETKAPNGFKLDDTKHAVELTDTQRDAIQLELENERMTTSVAIEKVWKDDQAETAKRPEFVVINLFQNGNFYQSYEVTEAEGWKRTIDGLPEIDENGDKYVYTMSEQEVLGYAPTYDMENLLVTNTRQGERDITITKTWYDDNNKDGDRPSEITVLLEREVFEYIDGEGYKGTGVIEEVGEYTVTAEDNWSHTITVPVFNEDGLPFSYEYKEINVPEGYQTASYDADITNTRVGTTDVKGEKFWKDDHAEENRPASITVQLFQNGDPIDQQEVTPNADGKWTYHFADLEKYDAEGVAYSYSIREEPVFGYQEMYWSTTPGVINIDNIRVGSTELTGKKTWIDADNAGETRPASITVELRQNGTVIEEQEVTSQEDWTYTFTQLPTYDKNGVSYEYTVREVAVDHYQASYKGNDITNTLIGETAVAVEKVWQGEAAEQIELQLLANGTVQETATVTAATDWTYVFEQLPKYDPKGIAIEYTIEEVAIDGYVSEVTGDMADGFTITNTRTGKTDLAVEKVWQGAEEELVTIHLLANGEEVDTVELTAENKWAHTFTDLAAFDSKGQAIVYTVEELAIDGYVSEVTGDMTDGFTVTNTRTGETEVAIEKVWKDDGAAASDRPDAIVVNLFANDVFVEAYEITAEADWTLIIKDLAKYDAVGDEIVYTISEHDVAGYALERIVGDMTEGFTITNTRVDEKSITIHKAWDEVTETNRPDAIKVALFRSVEGGEREAVEKYDVTAEANWSLTIEDLPAFDADGKAYTYEIEEIGVAEYNSSVNGFDITNTQKTYAIGDYVWIDRNKDGIQDDNEEALEGVTVELVDENGDVIMETTTDQNGRYIFDNLPAGDYQVKFTLTKEQAKKYKFTKQHAGDDARVDSNADENGWTTKISLNEKNEQLTKDYKDQNVEASEGIDPTWDAGVIELVDIAITKQWVDQDETTRPAAIGVELFANGTLVETYEVTAEADWKLVITGLAQFDENGEAINYTIDEQAVEQYEVEEITGDAVTGFNITNRWIEEEEEVVPPVEGEEPTEEDPKDPSGEPGEEDPGKKDPTEQPDETEKVVDEGNDKPEANEGSSGGHVLPKTATQMFTIGLIGVGLLLAGIALFVTRRNRTI